MTSCRNRASTEQPSYMYVMYYTVFRLTTQMTTGMTSRLTCMRPRPVLDTRLPVARKYSMGLVTSTPCWQALVRLAEDTGAADVNAYNTRNNLHNCRYVHSHDFALNNKFAHQDLAEYPLLCFLLFFRTQLLLNSTRQLSFPADKTATSTART